MRRPPYTPARSRVALAYACALAFVGCALAAAGIATGATSNVVVSMAVPSATSLVTTGCPPTTPGITDFGTVVPGSVVKTGTDCSVSFGSSNDSSSLRMAQADGHGAPMGNPTNVWTRHTGSSFLYYEIDSDPTHATTWAVGANGLVRRSQNGGDTWDGTISIGGANHTAISVPSASVAWAGGDGGTTIYRTLTGANVTPGWGAAPVGPGITVRGLAATSATAVWAVGDNGAIRASTDGGTTAGGWSSRTFTDQAGGPSATQDELRGINALDANSLVAFGLEGRVVATSDGTAWRDISLPVAIDVADVAIISDTTMVVVGDGRIYRTTNATNAAPTWNLVYNTSGYPSLGSVDFLDASTGAVVGGEGLLLRSSDGGASWSTESVDTSVEMHGVRYTSATGTSVVAVGHSGSIVRSTDSGANWDFEIGTNATFEDVSSASGTTWRVGSDGAVERSDDLGVTWSPQTSNTNADLNGVRALSATSAVAVGRGGVVIQTSNGGTTWTQRASTTTAELRAVDSLGSLAMAVATDGSIIRSQDGGVTWQTVRTPGGPLLRDVEVMSTTLTVAAGHSGALYRTTDGGSSWSSITGLPTATGNIQSLASDLPSGHLFYLAGSSTVRSTDGGVTWVTRSVTNHYNDIDTSSATRLVAVSGGYLRQSLDAGATWTVMSGVQVTYHDARAVDVLDGTTAITVGTGSLSGSTGSSASVPNYSIGVSDWYADGTEAFGACLRATTATPTWTVNGTCDQTADGAHWKGIPTVNDSSAEVASTGPTDGIRTADFRFGLRVAPNEPPGQLSADILFTVVAPDV